jgi:class 3 adenylate cyclase
VGGTFRGKGVHEAARIADVAEGGEIVASTATVGSSSLYPTSEPRTVELRGLSEPMDVVSIDWR